MRFILHSIKIIAMNKKSSKLIEKFLSIFENFENVITMVLSTIMGLIIIVALFRVVMDVYTLFVADIASPVNITFKDYQSIFGKIMTLLISIEFLSSILKVLKSHEIKSLVLDVVLITALAIARKLIIYDYDHHDPMTTFSLAAILLSTGLFYFLIKRIGSTED